MNKQSHKHFFKTVSKLHGNWNIYEKLLFCINLFVVDIILIYNAVTNPNDWTSYVAFVGNIFNILSVILATKKRVICFLWGILAVVCFGAIAFNNHAFGNMILYWAFYVPAQIIAWILWYKHSDDKVEIKPRKMKWWHVVLSATITIGLIGLFSWIETIKGFQHLWFGINETTTHYYLFRFILDATILISSLTMTIFAWLRFRERWVLSIFIDSIQTIFWITIALGADRTNGSSNSSMWIMATSSFTMLIAAIYGTCTWWRTHKK